MAKVEGSCLCGAVRIAVARPRSVTQCNCSVCRRYGTLWAYYRRGAVTIAAKRADLVSFSVKARGLRFRRCATCGCVVTWEHQRGPDGRLGVNTRLLDHTAMADVPIRVLDGDGAWKTLESYSKPGIWISPSGRTRPSSR